MQPNSANLTKSDRQTETIARLLMVGGQSDRIRQLKAHLTSHGPFDIQVEQTSEAGTRYLSGFGVDCIVLLDEQGAENPLSALSRLLSIAGRTPVIVIGDMQAVPMVNALLRLGAVDFLVAETLTAQLLYTAVHQALLPGNPHLVSEPKTKGIKSFGVVSADVLLSDRIVDMLHQVEAPADVEVMNDLFDVLDAPDGSSFDCLLIDAGDDPDAALGLVDQIVSAGLGCAIIMLVPDLNVERAAHFVVRGADGVLSFAQLTRAKVRRAVSHALVRNKNRNRKMRRDAELNRFLQTLVHDIRGPLQSIVATNDLMLSKFAKSQFDRAEKLMTLQGQTAWHAATLLDHLAAFAFLDEDIEFQPVDLVEIIELIQKNLGSGLHPKPVEFIVDPLPEIRAHKAQIMQLFQNLVENSSKFNVADKVMIAIRHRPSHPDVFYLTVEDNGIGMAQEELQSIFRPLERLHAKTDYAGSGLGLATCQKIIDAHEGHIWCTSTPGVGSNIHMIFRK